MKSIKRISRELLSSTVATMMGFSVVGFQVKAIAATCEGLFKAQPTGFSGYSAGELKFNDLLFAERHGLYVSGFKAQTVNMTHTSDVFSQVRKIDDDGVVSIYRKRPLVRMTDSKFELTSEEYPEKTLVITPNQIAPYEGDSVRIWQKVATIDRSSSAAEFIRFVRGIEPKRRLPRALDRYVDSDHEVHFVYERWDGTETVNDHNSSPPYLQNFHTIRGRGRLTKKDGELYLNQNRLRDIIPDHIGDYYFEVFKSVEAPRTDKLIRDSIVYRDSDLVPKTKWVTAGTPTERYDTHALTVRKFADLVKADSRYTLATQDRHVTQIYPASPERPRVADQRFKFKPTDIYGRPDPVLSGLLFQKNRARLDYGDRVSTPAEADPENFTYTRGAFLLKRVKSIGRPYLTALRLATSEAGFTQRLLKALKPYMDGHHFIEVQYEVYKKVDTHFGVLDGHLEFIEYRGVTKDLTPGDLGIASAVERFLKINVYRLEDASVLDVDRLPVE